MVKGFFRRGRRTINRVKELRLKKRLTQKQLAQYLNISERYLRAIEGGTVPGIYLRVKISRFFNTTVDEMFRLC